MSASERVLYLDSSALVKLVVREAESDALEAEVRRWPQRVSSALARVEVVRAARRASNEPAVWRRAARVVSAMGLIAADEMVLAEAARLEPAGLRTLDAIHLASALALGDQLGAFVAYDHRLLAAAQALALLTLSPS